MYHQFTTDFKENSPFSYGDCKNGKTPWNKYLESYFNFTKFPVVLQ